MFAAIRMTVLPSGLSLNSSLSPGLNFKKSRTSRGIVACPLLVMVAVGIAGSPVINRISLHSSIRKDLGSLTAEGLLADLLQLHERLEFEAEVEREFGST
jgi:hypothetical protein